jgi:membrane protease YdiL (CAAX protease family)
MMRSKDKTFSATHEKNTFFLDHFLKKSWVGRYGLNNCFMHQQNWKYRKPLPHSYRTIQFMTQEQRQRVVVSILSLPLAWAILQSYQHWIARPVGVWMLTRFSGVFDHLIATAKPEIFGPALCNLIIFGIIAAIWPDLGFGTSWKPDRRQTLLVLGLFGISLLYPIVNSILEYETPVKQMGYVVWTITPVEEEILFRGLLYALLLRLFRCSPEASWREILSVLVLGAAWFSLWHLSPVAIQKYGWGLIGTQVVLTFVAGLLFNGLRHWTGSIWLVIPVHAAGNFMISIM